MKRQLEKILAILLLFAFLIQATATTVSLTTGISNYNVSIIDTATNKVTATVKVGIGPWEVAVKQDGTKVYVVNTYSNNVSVIDTATNIVTATVKVGNGPMGIAVNSAGTKIYVANSGSNTTYVIDTDKGSKSRSMGYVPHEGTDSISVIDTATNKVTATVNVGREPRGIAVTPDGTKVYVGNIGNNNVSVIDTATNKVIASVPIGNSPGSWGQFIVTAPVALEKSH